MRTHVTKNDENNCHTVTHTPVGDDCLQPPRRRGYSPRTAGTGTAHAGHDDVLRLKGSLLAKDFNIALPLGERKIAIPMDATLKAYIDFSTFSEDQVERDGDRITIFLPDPKVVMTSSRIDRKEIREFVGLTRSQFTDQELTSYEQQGRQAIVNSIPQLGIVDMARENAARVLVPMLTEMGYKEENVTIAFRRGLDLSRLFDANIEKK